MYEKLTTLSGYTLINFVEKTKPAVYYLGLNGIRYLRSITVVDENGKRVSTYSSNELHKRYRERERSQTYIDRCLLVADGVLALERARTDTKWYYYETEAEYLIDSFYHLLADEWEKARRRQAAYAVRDD